jgi:hypothetical protein
MQQQAGGEGPQLQRAQVDPSPHLRIGRIEHLETAIEQEARLPIGTHPAADPITGLKHPDHRAGLD